MSVMSIPPRQKSWQNGRERVSVLAALAIHRESVSQKLLELRESQRDPATGKPLSQERAAARVGATSRTWQRWENGETVPYPRNLEAIADEFGFEVGEFFDGEEEVVSSKDARQSPRQLDRIEAMLADILKRLPEEPAPARADRDTETAEVQRLLEAEQGDEPQEEADEHHG